MSTLLFRYEAQKHVALYQARTFQEFTSILMSASPVDIADLEAGSVVNGGARYAKATGTWVRGAGHTSTVTAIEVTDPTGATTVGAAFSLILPRYNLGRDPNVYADDILTFAEISSGGSSLYYATGDYLDDRIGTVKGITHTTIPNGWEICDGGGSIPNFVNKFLRGAATYGGSGGADTHGHTGSITVNSGTAVITTTSLSITGSTGSASPAVSGSTASGTANIADHPDHKHQSEDFCLNAESDGATYYHATAKPITTGGMLSIGGGSPITYTHTDSGHTHGAGTLATASHSHSAGTLAIDPNPHGHTDSGHAHTGSVTINDGNNVPVYVSMIWIIRIGPSGEIS